MIQRPASLGEQHLEEPDGFMGLVRLGYGSIPVNTIFRGMNIHLPAILM